jgi:serine/threonine protein kinase
MAGQIMGTAGYMAPEQVDGEKVDHRADVFAFGCVLCELATDELDEFIGGRSSR